MNRIAALIFTFTILIISPLKIFAEESPSPTIAATTAPTVTPTATTTATASPSPTATNTPSGTATPTSTPSPTKTATPKPKANIATTSKKTSPSPSVAATTLPSLAPSQPATAPQVKSYSTTPRNVKNPGIVSGVLVFLFALGICGGGIFILRKNPKLKAKSKV